MTTLQTLFESQARLTPNAIAIEANDGSVTYHVLDTRANQLAHGLRQRGVGVEDIVGVYLERTPELFVAILGVLKAGAAYVPLATDHPVSRTRDILEQSRARFVLTDRAVQEWPLRGGPALPVTLQDWAALDQYPQTPPCSRYAPASLAYVIYTSGSTGKPKGVAVSHAGLAPCAAAFKAMCDAREGDRVLQLSPQTFDGSMFELLTVLTTGATLCLASSAELLPGELLSRTLRRKRVTIGLFVTSQLAAMPADDLSSLRVVVTGAEPTPRSVCARWMRPGRIMWNTYGTTETTIVASAYRVDLAPFLPDPVPIGRPLTHVEWLVLDEEGIAVPNGVPGELYIGGLGLARGYLNRPGLTAERFVPHPFGGVLGARFFRTGDRVRRLPDGEFEFVGRDDQQVKVHGVRIELGEIEAALRSIPGVSDCAVLAVGDEPHTRRIVAYVVPSAATTLPPSHWRRALEELLPLAMVPSHLIPLASLPIGPTGKLDRARLPSVQRAEETSAISTELNGSDTEEALRGIWCAVLDSSAIGLDDDFFVVGGHSFVAGQILARVREQLGVRLSFGELLRARTIRAIAGTIQESRDAGLDYWGPLELATRDVAPGTLPLSYAQERMWYLTQHNPDRYVTIPVAIRLRGILHRQALTASITALVRRHQMLRTTITVERGIPVQVVRTAATSLPTFDDVDIDPRKVQEVLGVFFRTPYDLASETALRVRVLRLGTDDCILLIALHHVYGDRWSTGILLRELERLYNSFVRGESVGMPEHKVEYSDYVQWERAALADPRRRERYLAFWRDQLRDLQTLALPLDKPRETARAFEGGSYRFVLDAAAVRGFKALVAKEGATQFMGLVMVFDLVLAAACQQRDIAIGTLVRGRPSSSVDGLIGFFTNVLVLRNSLADNPPLRALLHRVRDSVAEALEHQALPFQWDPFAARESPRRSHEETPEALFLRSWRADSREMFLREHRSPKNQVTHGRALQRGVARLLQPSKRGPHRV